MIKHTLYKAYRSILRLFQLSHYVKKYYAHVKGNNVFWVKVYYFLFDNSFDRELQSVYLGKKMHDDRVLNNLPNTSKLRREIHRIEKGLIVSNRKDFFAQGYINQTIDALRATYDLLNLANKSWCINVLDEYFNIISEGNNQIDKARVSYNSFKKNIKTIKTNTSKPFNVKSLEDISVNVQQIQSLASRRHSTRSFTDKKIEREVLENAIKVGLQAPSACNRQPFEVIFTNEKEILEKAVNLPMGVTTFKDQIKNLAIVVGDLSYYFDERDRHLIYIDASLFAMSFLFGLESQGVSSCVINWPDIEKREKELYNLFNLPKHKRCIFFIALGYADTIGMIPYSEKKDVNDVLRYNEKHTD